MTLPLLCNCDRFQIKRESEEAIERSDIHELEIFECLSVFSINALAYLPVFEALAEEK